jgi:hypothetical protein
MTRLPIDVFTAFGYAVPTEADLAPGPASAVPVPPHPLDSCLLESNPFHPVPGGYGIQVCATDAEFAAEMVAVFQHPDLLALFAAGGLTPVTRRGGVTATSAVETIIPRAALGSRGG